MTITNSPGQAERLPDARNRLRRRAVERRDGMSRDLVLQRILAEFREMPCLRLTPAQAQRLFGLRRDVVTRVIDTLMKEGHVRLDLDGRYAATDAG